MFIEQQKRAQKDCSKDLVQNILVIQSYSKVTV